MLYQYIIMFLSQFGLYQIKLIHLESEFTSAIRNSSPQKKVPRKWNHDLIFYPVLRETLVSIHVGILLYKDEKVVRAFFCLFIQVYFFLPVLLKIISKLTE